MNAIFRFFVAVALLVTGAAQAQWVPGQQLGRECTRTLTVSGEGPEKCVTLAYIREESILVAEKSTPIIAILVTREDGTSYRRWYDRDKNYIRSEVPGEVYSYEPSFNHFYSGMKAGDPIRRERFIANHSSGRYQVETSTQIQGEETVIWGGKSIKVLLVNTKDLYKARPSYTGSFSEIQIVWDVERGWPLQARSSHLHYGYVQTLKPLEQGAESRK